MKNILQRLEARYGEDWFTYQPPGARPILLTQNFNQLESTPPREFIREFCQIEIPTSEVLVVNRYSITIWDVVASPHHAGDSFPVQLPPTFLQGAWRWRPVINKEPPYQITSILDDVPFNWNAPTYLPERHDGFSLFRGYSQKTYVPPGTTFALSVGRFDSDAGFRLRPAAYFVAEVEGYFVSIPHKVDHELYEDKAERHMEKLSKRIAEIPPFSLPAQDLCKKEVK